MFKIRSKYPDQPWEDIDTFDMLEEAVKMLHEYRVAYGPEWQLTIKRAVGK